MRLTRALVTEPKFMAEFNRQLDSSITIIPDAVRTEPNFMTLFAEYNKYLLRRLSVWLDI